MQNKVARSGEKQSRPQKAPILFFRSFLSYQKIQTDYHKINNIISGVGV